MALTGKKLSFAINYAIHENGARACRDAGYSEKTANRKAYQLLQDPEIKAEIDKLIAERMKRLEITGDRVLNELAKIAFTDTTDIIDLAKGVLTIEDFEALSPEQRACIQSAKKTKEGIEIKLYDKIAALTKLGQNQKLFTDVQEQKHSFTKMGDVKVADESGEAKPLEFDIGREPDEVVH